MWKTDKNRVKSGLHTVDNYVDGVDSIVNMHKITQNNYAPVNLIRAVSRLEILHGACRRAAKCGSNLRKLQRKKISITAGQVRCSLCRKLNCKTKKPLPVIQAENGRFTQELLEKSVKRWVNWSRSIRFARAVPDRRDAR